MASSIALRFIAFIVFAVVVGGSTYGAYQSLQPEDLALRGISVTPAESALSVAPGGAFDVGVVVTNSGEVAESVRVLVRGPDGFESTGDVVVDVPAKNATGVFVPVTLPGDAAAGDVALTVIAETVAEPVKRAQSGITVTVLDADTASITEGDGVLIQYVGRLATNDSLFQTNVPAYADLPFPRTGYFRASAQDATVYTDPNANLIPGFREALIGMYEGEWRTIRLDAEDAYGPNEVTTEDPRRVTLERSQTLPVREVTASPSEFESLVADSGKPASEYEVGDRFATEIQGDTYRFLVTNITEDGYAYRLDPDLGDRYTMPDHPYWPQGAVVTAANETAVEIRIEPTTAEGEAFTFHAYWPDASRVAAVNETAIVIEHSPAEGSTFERPVSRGGEPVTHTVTALTDDTVVSTYEEPFPLAGEDIVFNLRVLEILPPR